MVKILKHIGVSVLFLTFSIILHGCIKDRHEFSDVQIKTALKLALNDHSLKRRMGLFQENKVKKWVLFGPYQVNETFTLEDRHYRLSKTNSFVKSDSTILYTITYKDDSANLILKYIPSPTYMITGSFQFRFNQGVWILNGRSSSIVDGKF